jgi:hypothetical protein
MDSFVFVNFPATVKNKLRNIALAGMRKTTEYQIQAGTRHVSGKQIPDSGFDTAIFIERSYCVLCSTSFRAIL